MKRYRHDQIRRYIKRNGGYAWFQNGTACERLDLEEFEALLPAEAVKYFHEWILNHPGQRP